MAANKPNAVAKSASAIPGATIAKLVFLEIAIDWNEFIIPQTVPNNPIKGAVEPTVAKKVKPLSILEICFSIPASSIPVILSLKFVFDLDFNKYKYKVYNNGNVIYTSDEIQTNDINNIIIEWTEFLAYDTISLKVKTFMFFLVVCLFS